jgi:hypothetical protein
MRAASCCCASPSRATCRVRRPRRRDPPIAATPAAAPPTARRPTPGARGCAYWWRRTRCCASPPPSSTGLAAACELLRNAARHSGHRRPGVGRPARRAEGDTMRRDGVHSRTRRGDGPRTAPAAPRGPDRIRTVRVISARTASRSAVAMPCSSARGCGVGGRAHAAQSRRSRARRHGVCRGRRPGRGRSSEKPLAEVDAVGDARQEAGAHARTIRARRHRADRSVTSADPARKLSAQQPRHRVGRSREPAG